MAGNLVKLNRKCLFLENRDTKLTEEVKKLKKDLVNSEVVSKSVTTKLRTETEILTHKLNLIQTLQSGLVDKQIMIQVQSDLDSITVKYRSALRSYESLKTDYTDELSVLKLNNENLQQQNRELHNQLLEIPREITSEGVEVQTNMARKLAESQINELTEKQRANHMNNLYVLVKEQFEKSENRFQELEKFNKDILCKNLDLQEAVKDLEDKVIDCIDVQAYKDLETKYLKTSEELQRAVVVKSNLEEQLREAKSELGCSDSVASSNIEVLSLKHQILDLQSESDEKALIAKLGTDVVYARIAENETRKQLESVSEDSKEYQEKYENCKTALEQSQTNHQEATIKFQEKLR